MGSPTALADPQEKGDGTFQLVGSRQLDIFAVKQRNLHHCSAEGYFPFIRPKTLLWSPQHFLQSQWPGKNWS